MTEEWIRYHQLEPHNIKTVFENLKADYRNVKFIPCPGSLTIAVDKVLDERTYKKAGDGFSDLMEACGRGHWKPNPMTGNWHI
jgi:hypothetical protein